MSEKKLLDTCTICLDDITPQNMSSLDCCNHKFCFECITIWACKAEKLCPNCIKQFKKIQHKDKCLNLEDCPIFECEFCHEMILEYKNADICLMCESNYSHGGCICNNGRNHGLNSDHYHCGECLKAGEECPDCDQTYERDRRIMRQAGEKYIRQLEQKQRQE